MAKIKKGDQFLK